LASHIEGAVETRENSVSSLVAKYNNLVSAINKLIEQGKAPEGAICPKSLDSKGLYALDVDDEIWQDVGLDDESCGVELPGWLVDDEVRGGIRAVLEYDRCLEEEHRLVHERRSLQIWFAGEWDLLMNAILNEGVFLS
jgi:hypothetical protein